MLRRPARRSKNKSAAPTQTAIGWLGSDQHGSSVLTTARMLISIQHAAKQVLPPALAAVCRVARVEQQHITLAVPSAAYAARLRQLAPRIVQLLTQSGWNLNEISVRVQAGLLQSQIKTTPIKQAQPLGETALNAFEELQGKLDAGPLADAIGRLLMRHRSP